MNEKPKKIIKEYYCCPYCNLYNDYSEGVVSEHMKTCSYNPNLPKRDCASCKHKIYYYANEKHGHANSYRPIVRVRKGACRKGCSCTSAHSGNSCAYYVKEGIDNETK